MRAFLRTKQEEELTPESFGNFYDSAQQPADPGIVHSPPQRAGGIFLPQPSMDQQTHAEYYHRYYQQAQACWSNRRICRLLLQCSQDKGVPMV